MSESTGSLAKKMVAAMGEIEAVTKSGKNEKQGYKYVRAADVANEVRKVLVKHGIAMFYSVESSNRWEKPTNSGGSMFFCELMVQVTFVDADTGETMVQQGIGWGADTLEKAPYKAMTGALKYVLRMTFLIPDEEDPENEKKDAPEVVQVEFITSAQAKEFREACTKKNVKPETVKKALQAMGISSTAQIPVSELQGFYTWLEDQEGAS